MIGTIQKMSDRLFRYRNTIAVLSPAVTKKNANAGLRPSRRGHQLNAKMPKNAPTFWTSDVMPGPVRLLPVDVLLGRFGEFVLLACSVVALPCSTASARYCGSDTYCCRSDEKKPIPHRPI